MKPCLEKGLLPEKVHTSIFGELAALQYMNKELHQALVDDSENIGKAFLHLAPFLKVYSSYAKNYQRAVNLLLASTLLIFYCAAIYVYCIKLNSFFFHCLAVKNIINEEINN